MLACLKAQQIFNVDHDRFESFGRYVTDPVSFPRGCFGFLYNQLTPAGLTVNHFPAEFGRALAVMLLELHAELEDLDYVSRNETSILQSSSDSSTQTLATPIVDSF